MFGDSRCVISWMNLKSNCTGVMKREVDSMRLTMHVTWSQLNFGATAVSEDMFQWIPRDFNKIADELADTGCLIGNRIIEHKPMKSNNKFFRVYFDRAYECHCVCSGFGVCDNDA